MWARATKLSVLQRNELIERGVRRLRKALDSGHLQREKIIEAAAPPKDGKRLIILKSPASEKQLLYLKRRYKVTYISVLSTALQLELEAPDVKNHDT